MITGIMDNTDKAIGKMLIAKQTIYWRRYTMSEKIYSLTRTS